MRRHLDGICYEELTEIKNYSFGETHLSVIEANVEKKEEMVWRIEVTVDIS